MHGLKIYPIWNLWIDLPRLCQIVGLISAVPLFVPSGLLEINKFTKVIRDLEQRQQDIFYKSVIWRPPEQGFCKINFDDAVDIKKHRSCSRIVVRDCNGDVLAKKQ
ncbi:reverse transcriptase [Gossypium australe]|uniref:Reverse transcriptase n=1 Tax=Gossypium australe TaxID=47621 RepID=A0A5B6VVB8_9ROSI|nr:reverse transcriptase [Gossypium australe]